MSSRIGGISRKLTLPDGSVFETSDNAGVDRWIGGSRAISGSGLLHHMETRWSWIAVALIAVISMVWLGGRYGLPWASEQIARAMPERMVEYVSDGSLDLLDRIFLEPSELPSKRQQVILGEFESTYGDDYALHFRKLGLPNAFALPNGDIIVTDSFVEIAEEDEFTAVILHEIGHIDLRHGMQQLVRSSIVTFIVAMMVGDPSGLEEVVVGLPVFLMQSHYSRKHESEADEFAFDRMMNAGIDPIHFASIMGKLETFVPETEMDDSNPGDTSELPDADHSDSDHNLTDYLSSHPATTERIENARARSMEFRSR